MITLTKEIKSENISMEFINKINGLLDLPPNPKYVFSIVLDDKNIKIKDLLSKSKLKGGSTIAAYYTVRNKGLLDNEIIDEMYKQYKETGVVIFKDKIK